MRAWGREQGPGREYAWPTTTWRRSEHGSRPWRGVPVRRRQRQRVPVSRSTTSSRGVGPVGRRPRERAGPRATGACPRPCSLVRAGMRVDRHRTGGRRPCTTRTVPERGPGRGREPSPMTPRRRRRGRSRPGRGRPGRGRRGRAPGRRRRWVRLGQVQTVLRGVTTTSGAQRVHRSDAVREPATTPGRPLPAGAGRASRPGGAVGSATCSRRGDPASGSRSEPRRPSVSPSRPARSSVPPGRRCPRLPASPRLRGR